MTKLEAKQRVLKIAADGPFNGVMDIVNGKRTPDDITRDIIQSLCDLICEMIESLPDEEPE